MTGRWKKTAGERHGRGKGAIEEAILGACGESEGCHSRRKCSALKSRSSGSI